MIIPSVFPPLPTLKNSDIIIDRRYYPLLTLGSQKITSLLLTIIN